MRTRTLLLSAMFLTAVVTTARSQSAPLPAKDGPAEPAAAMGDKSAAPAVPTAAATDTTIKDTDTVHAPVAAKSKDASGKDTLSVDFPDTDIREILRNVADLFELNLVMPDTLQGKASIKLRDVTWRQIFEVVLKQVGYTFIEKDNIVKIVSMKDLQEEPFTTKTFSFENVSSSRIMPLIVGMLTPKRDATPTDLAHAGGTIVNSELANELIVTDQSTVIARIGEMIKRLDTEPRQVVIETKFVEISKDDSKNREVALGLNKANGLKIGTGIGIPGNTGTIPFPFNLNSGLLAGGSPTAVFNQREFSALINILNAQTNVRLVTNPTIVAINGSKSEIKIGRELQLVTITTVTSGSSPVTTATAGDIKFVGISLEVTPQITGSKLISLKVKPVKSSIFKANQIQGNTFYDIDKREGDLNIILRDGQTAAIGGLVDTSTNRTVSKVPLLGDIPILGSLFKRDADVKSETNLIIFITATVLEPSKMKYENVVTKEQLNSLELTPRDILGRNYTKSDEEISLEEQVGIARQQKQNDATLKELSAQAAAASKKK
jgi:type IV pilus assembly protein PilQ